MSVQIGIPVDEALLAEIDSLATLMGSPWHKPTRADVARIGLAIGIGALKAQASAMVSALAAASAPALNANAASAYSASPFASGQDAAPQMDSNPLAPATVGISHEEAPEGNDPGPEQGERDSVRHDEDATNCATESTTLEASPTTSPIGLNPSRLRARLNEAFAAGTVKIKDLAQEISVGTAYIYGFKGGKPMSPRKLQELDAALARRESSSTSKARTLNAEGLRDRLTKAIATRNVKVKELAEQAGINATSVYVFKAGGPLGHSKLEALDRALTNFELTSTQSDPPSIWPEHPMAGAQAQPSPSADETPSTDPEKATDESACVVVNPAQVQAKLVKAIADGASVQDLAQETGIAASYIGTFRYSGKMGQQKLQALDAALTRQDLALGSEVHAGTRDSPSAPSAGEAFEQPSIDVPPISLGASLRNRPNVVLIHRSAPEISASTSQPSLQPPSSRPLTPEEIAERVIEVLSDGRTVLTLPQIQHNIREPAATLAPVLARLISENRLGVTEVGGIAAYKLVRRQLSLDDMLKK